MAEITIRISDKTLRTAGLVLAGIGLASVVLYSWSSGLFLPKYRLRMFVSEAAGLAVGAPVRLDGIDIGTVRAIELGGSPASPERRIELVLRIQKRYQDKILTDSKAELVTEGLLGNRYVMILRGLHGSPILAEGEIASVSTKTIELRDFVDSVAKFVDCLREAKRKDQNKSPQH